jgi:hypothetical protein
MSRTSLDIMKSYQYYNSIIKTYDPTFLFDANTIQTGSKNYLIPTSLGVLNVGPIQGNMLIYGKWQVNESLGLGFIAVVNSIDLQINDEEHPELRDTDGPFGDLYAWKNSKYIIAIRPDFDPEIEITIGVLMSQVPYVTMSEDSVKQFDIFYYEEEVKEGEEKKEGEYRTYTEKNELFLEARIYGYYFGTLYEFEENSLSLLEVKRFFDMGKETGSLSVGFNYYNYLNTYQAGFEYQNTSLFSLFPIQIEAYWDIYKNGNWNDVGYFLFKANQNLFKNDSVELSNIGDKDFYINVEAGTSYSKDLFVEGLFGYSLDFDFRNIWGYWQSLSVGYSYNYHDNIHRLPIENEHMIHIAFRIMID